MSRPSDQLLRTAHRLEMRHMKPPRRIAIKRIAGNQLEFQLEQTMIWWELAPLLATISDFKAEWSVEVESIIESAFECGFYDDLPIQYSQPDDRTELVLRRTEDLLAGQYPLLFLKDKVIHVIDSR